MTSDIRQKPSAWAGFVLGAVSWGMGLVAYSLVLWIRFEETASRGDWRAVAFYSGLVYLTLARLVYWPLFAWLAMRVSNARRFVLYPLVGILVPLLPVVALGWRFESGAARAQLSPEVSLFLWLFATAGAVWGVGYAMLTLSTSRIHSFRSRSR